MGLRRSLPISASEALTIRPLRSDEWEAFRSIRLMALRTEPGMFFSSFEHDSALGADEWRGWLATQTQCVFGVFAGGTLVGITAVYTHRDDPDGQTALLGTSYVQPAYRGRGLARLLYETRLAWIRSRGTFRRVVVSHRRSNEPSRRAIERYGFALTGSEPRTWPDGAVDDELLYALDLTRDALVARESPTLEPPWLDVPNIVLGDRALRAHLLVERGGVPYRRFELHGVSRSEAWVRSDAITWKGLLAIGFAQRAYVMPVAGGTPRQIDFESYFSRFYAGESWLLVVSGGDVLRLDESGDVVWRSEEFGIDGIIIERVANGRIEGQYAYDPPDGWGPFALALDDGSISSGS